MGKNKLIITPKKHSWFHRLFRTKQWKAAKLAELIVNYQQQEICAKVDKEILKTILYGKGEELTFH